jgi:hypothetical protein
MLTMTRLKYIYDDTGKRAEVILPVEDFEALLEALEDAEDVMLYDEAKREDDGTRISFEEMKKRLGLQ